MGSNLSKRLDKLEKGIQQFLETQNPTGPIYLSEGEAIPEGREAIRIVMQWVEAEHQDDVQLEDSQPLGAPNSAQSKTPSTLPPSDQEAGFQAQIKALKAHGCEKVFAEQVSSVAKRDQLEAALDYLREDDALVITKLDRLARSVADLVAIGARLDAKRVTLRVLDQAIDTSTPTGRLMFNMLGSIAQFERELMLERQREGIAKAKAEGKYKGRKPTARAKGAEVKRLRLEGIGPTAIAKRLNISRASVYRLA